MPFIATTTSSGPANFHYIISTPTEPDAPQIDPTLPTVLFLHAVYLSSSIFHPQFADASLRRFNLIALDARLHGKTTGVVPTHWRQAEGAEDVSFFMDALSLPPCHIVGLSMGAAIGLELAVSYPERVLSLCMISPLSLEEPADVVEGRQEIYECWARDYSDINNPDATAYYDAVHGSVELAFNGQQQDKLIQTALILTVPDALRNWGPEALDQYHTVSVKFFRDRKPHTLEALRRVQCPIILVHCGADIAYPHEFAEEVCNYLQEAGLNSHLVSVQDAPHYGTVNKAKEINPIIHDFIVQNTEVTLPPPPSDVVSPFETMYAENGCPLLGVEVDSDDTDDEFDIRVPPTYFLAPVEPLTVADTAQKLFKDKRS